MTDTGYPHRFVNQYARIPRRVSDKVVTEFADEYLDRKSLLVDHSKLKGTSVGTYRRMIARQVLPKIGKHLVGDARSVKIERVLSPLHKSTHK